MIYTLTPNPALDLSGHVPQIVPNEKNYVTRARRDPGGNGINAARVALRLGAKVLALGFAGGSAGKEIESLLGIEGVPTKFIKIQADTRTNVTVSNDSTHQQTRLTFPGPRVTRAEVQRMFSTISTLKGPGLFLLGGSIPEGCPKNFHLMVARAASSRGLGVVVDIPAKFLSTYLAGRSAPTLFLKPNQAELEECVGHGLSRDVEIARAALELSRKIDLVCVSLAERGAIVALGRRAWFCKAPKIKARGTVGAGDSMVGAIATRLAHFKLTKGQALRRIADSTQGKQMPPQLADIMNWGLAAGAATAESEGTQLADPARVRALSRQVKVTYLTTA